MRGIFVDLITGPPCRKEDSQAPCPVNLRSIQASGGTWLPYLKRCGDQADAPMMLATLAHNYTQLQCIFIVLPLHYPMCCNARQIMIHCGVRPPLRTALIAQHAPGPEVYLSMQSVGLPRPAEPSHHAQAAVNRLSYCSRCPSLSQLRPSPNYLSVQRAS